MPYRMHSEYLRERYLNNDLAEGRFEVGGKSTALQDLRSPIFAVSTERVTILLDLNSDAKGAP